MSQIIKTDMSKTMLLQSLRKIVGDIIPVERGTIVLAKNQRIRAAICYLALLKQNFNSTFLQ